MAPKNKSGNTNGSSSSSSSSTTTPALSKKQEATVVSILEQVKAYAHNSSTEANKIEQYVGKQPADLLTIAVNREHYLEQRTGKKINILNYMTNLAMFNLHPAVRHNARIVIRLALKAGAVLETTDVSSPILQLMQENEENKIYRNQNEFSKTLEAFFECNDLINVREEYDLTIAHTAARYSCGSLRKVLNRFPNQLVNYFDENGETPLVISIKSSQIDNVKMLIREYGANLHFMSDRGMTPLGHAIITKRLPMVRELMVNGCPISPYNNTRLPEDREFLDYLSQCGYFMVDTHLQEHGFNLFEALSISKTDFGFISLLDERTGIREVIYSGSDLKKTTLKPTAQQLKRLYLSIDEIYRFYNDDAQAALKELGIESMEALDAMSEEEIAPLKTRNLLAFYNIGRFLLVEDLYSTLSEKFPLDASLRFPLIGLQLTTTMRFDVSKLQALLYTATQYSKSETVLDSLEGEELNIYLNMDLNRYTNDRLKAIVLRFSRSANHALINLMGSDDAAERYRHFAFKLIYHFATRVLISYIKRVTAKEITDINHEMVFLISLTANYFNNIKAKSRFKLNDFIQTVIDLLKTKGVGEILIKELSLVASLQQLMLYGEAANYKDLIRAIDEIKGYPAPVINGGFVTSILAVTYQALIGCLMGMSFDDYEIDSQSQTIDAILEFLKEPYFRNDRFEEVEAKARHLCKTNRDKIAGRYKEMAEALTKRSTDTVVFSDATEAKVKVTYKFSQGIAVDEQRLRKKVRSIDYVEVNDKGFFLKVKGINKTDIDRIIDELMSITTDDVIKEPTEAVKGTESSPSIPADSVSTPVSFYNPEDCVVKAQTNPIKKEKSAVVSKTLIMSERKSTQKKTAHEQIVAELKAKYKLPDDALVFPIDNPYVPEERRHLCYGYWGEIEGKNVNSVPDSTLEAHRQIAMSGKVAVFSSGENGLRPTVVDNLAGGSREGLKTKIAKASNGVGDIRVNAAVIKVRISTGESVSFYPFGVISKHKQAAVPKINPNSFIK